MTDDSSTVETHTYTYSLRCGVRACLRRVPARVQRRSRWAPACCHCHVTLFWPICRRNPPVGPTSLSVPVLLLREPAVHSTPRGPQAWEGPTRRRASLRTRRREATRTRRRLASRTQTHALRRCTAIRALRGFPRRACDASGMQAPHCCRPELSLTAAAVSMCRPRRAWKSTSALRVRSRIPGSSVARSWTSAVARRRRGATCCTSLAAGGRADVARCSTQRARRGLAPLLPPARRGCCRCAEGAHCGARCAGRGWLLTSAWGGRLPCAGRERGRALQWGGRRRGRRGGGRTMQPRAWHPWLRVAVL